MKKSIILAGVFIFFMFYTGKARSAGFAGTERLLSLDARMGSLGTAFDALSDNVDSIYYNPAGLALMESIMLNCSYVPGWDANTSIYYFGLGFPNRALPFGVGYCNVDSGGIPVRESSPEILQVAGYQNISTFLSGSYSLASGLSLGLRIKVNYLKLYSYHDWSTGADLSLLWRRSDPYAFTKSALMEALQPVSVGVVLYNVFSTGIRLRESSEKDSLVLKSGLSYRFRRLFKFLELEPGIGLESVSAYSTLSYSAGLEMVFWNMAFIRSGYRISDRVFTLGTGLKVWEMQADFGLSFLPLSNNYYSLNLKIRFN